MDIDYIMKKIQITEEQYNTLMSHQEDINEIINDETSSDNCKATPIYENIERTVGNLEVRDLIKEGDEITGEVKSGYGIWSKMSWTTEGDVKNFGDNVFKKLTYKIQL